MKKFLIASIYISLALLVIGYMFRIMHFDGARELLWGGLWMHIASYVGYSFVVKNKDNRIGYALIILIAIVAINTFKPDISYNQSLVLALVISIAYVSVHLFIKNYLHASSPKMASIFSFVAFGVFLVGALFKIMHWPSAGILSMVGLSALAVSLVLIGVTKPIAAEA